MLTSMKWDDLLPGDKLRLSDATVVRRKNEAWFDRYGFADDKDNILEIHSTNSYHALNGELRIIIEFTNRLRITIDKFGRSIMYPDAIFAELIELCEGNDVDGME